jgi:tRNA(Ile)-lysidine synthetase-like protein
MTYDALVIERRDQMPIAEHERGYLMNAGSSFALAVPSVTEIEGKGWRIEVHEGLPPATNVPLGYALHVPLGARLLLRTRQNGDRFSPKGLDGHSQKLKQWMIDRKVPSEVRDQVPLLCVNDHIAMILWGENPAIGDAFWDVSPETTDKHIISVFISASQK